MHVAAHEEGEVHGTEFMDRNFLHPAVHGLVEAETRFGARLAQLREQIFYEPLIVACGSGTAFFHKVVSRQAEQGVHQHAAVGDRRSSNILIDAPGSGDHTESSGIGETHAQRAGIDVKSAASHRRSLGKPGFSAASFVI